MEDDFKNKGAVAFIDILGFKGIWQRRNPKEVLYILNKVSETIINSYEHPPQNWPETSPPQVVILSDTIVITIDTKETTPESEKPSCLLILGNIINGVIRHLYKGNFFIRGAVGYGEYIQSKNTFIGPLIDDVASWYEVADLIGIISTPKTNYIIDQLSNMNTKFEYNNFKVPLFIKYDVPYKSDNVYPLNCLNWPGYLQAAYNESPNNSSKSKTHILMEQLFTKQAEFDSSVLKKYENTLKFVDHAVCSIKLKSDE